MVILWRNSQNRDLQAGEPFAIKQTQTRKNQSEKQVEPIYQKLQQSANSSHSEIDIRLWPC